jgi:hypothetical protein
VRPDNRTEGDTLAMGTRRPTGSSPLQLVMSLAGALVLAVVQLSGVVDAEWTDYLPHETCGAVHALTPRVLFYSPHAPTNMPQNSEECVRACALVDGAGTALYYAMDATVRTADGSRLRFMP